MVRGEAIEASKRRRSKLDYRSQQHCKGSSEGSGISSDNENKAEENKDEDGNDAEKQNGEEEPVDAQAGIEQARGEQANV
ncbi:hypothetical protein Tco_0957205 [Tanacetum coccineum]